MTKKMRFSKRLDAQKKQIPSKTKHKNKMPIRGGLIVRRKE